MQMENRATSAKHQNIKTSQIIYQPPLDGKENLSKKRPSTTKLDLEKMFEESIELTTLYRQLMKENKILKQQFQKVEAIKINRQNLISSVQKIVEEKARDLNGKTSNHSSWLVFKLNSKIYDLKAKIQGKEKLIKELQLSKEAQMIRQKQTEIECLDEVLKFARDNDLVEDQSEKKGFELVDLNNIKEIVWMEQQIRQRQEEILEAQKIYNQEQKQVKKLMQELAKKKAQLKSILEMENEYHRAQQAYKEEKKKKQQKMAGNKSYIEELHQLRNQEIKKLQNLKNKYAIMESEENDAIHLLQEELAKLKIQYQSKGRLRRAETFKLVEQTSKQFKERWVRRVTFEQVKRIAKHLNYMMSIKGVSIAQIGQIFVKDSKPQFSIKEVLERFSSPPFCMQNQTDRMLIARYVVEDTGDGLFLEDMDTSQSALIIKSVICKLIGEIKLYEKEEAQFLLNRNGNQLLRFGKLVQNNIEIKDGNKKFVNKERMQDAIQSLQIQFNSNDIEFIIFYLFSWSRDIQMLQVAKLYQLVNGQGINWAKREDPCF